MDNIGIISIVGLVIAILGVIATLLQSSEGRRWLKNISRYVLATLQYMITFIKKYSSKLLKRIFLLVEKIFSFLSVWISVILSLSFIGFLVFSGLLFYLVFTRQDFSDNLVNTIVPLTHNLSFTEFVNSITPTSIVILLLLFASLVILRIHFKISSLNKKIHEREYFDTITETLLNFPEVQSMLENYENQLLDDIRKDWFDFLRELKIINHFAGLNLTECLPLEVRWRTLVVACSEKAILKNIYKFSTHRKEPEDRILIDTVEFLEMYFKGYIRGFRAILVDEAEMKELRLKLYNSISEEQTPELNKSLQDVSDD